MKEFFLVVILLFIVAFCVILPYVRYQQLKRRHARHNERLNALYKKIPASTMVTMKDGERRFYRLVAVAAIVIWGFGMAAVFTVTMLPRYPFLVHPTEKVQVTVVDLTYVHTKKSVGYDDLLLSAEVNGAVVQDRWTIVPIWFTIHEGDVADGLVYWNGTYAELGIYAAIYPLFHWQQVLGMLLVTLLAWAVAIHHWRFAAKKHVRFEELSLIDKMQRVGKVK